MELAGLAGCLGFGFGLGGCVMGGPDSNRDLCKIGNGVGIPGYAGYYYAFGQYRHEMCREIFFVEMSGLEWGRRYLGRGGEGV
jgi:hypothetical protein